MEFRRVSRLLCAVLIFSNSMVSADDCAIIPDVNGNTVLHAEMIENSVRLTFLLQPFTNLDVSNADVSVLFSTDIWVTLGIKNFNRMLNMPCLIISICSFQSHSIFYITDWCTFGQTSHHGVRRIDRIVFNQYVLYQ